MSGFGKVSGRYQEGLRKVSGRCLEGDWNKNPHLISTGRPRVSVMCLEGD